MYATEPVRVVFSEQKEFLMGDLDGVSITSDGKLVLAPLLEPQFETEEAFIYSAVVDDVGAFYLGSGNNGKIFRVNSQGQGIEWSKLEEPAVYALAIDSDGHFYAATGPNGKVYVINSQGDAQVFFDPQEQYIWTLAIDEQGNVLVGTGPRGVIYKVDSRGQGDIFYDSNETHITSLEWDLNDNLLVGTSPGGLLIRMSPKGTPFVIYDSALQEIKSIAVDRYGNIYAAGLSRSQGITQSQPAQQLSQADNVLRQQDGPPKVAGEYSVQIGQTVEGAQLQIYKVDKDNLVDVLYSSDDELAFDLLIRSNGSLLIGTGNKGRIISIDSRKFVTFLVGAPEQQVTQLLEWQENILATTSNLGRAFRLWSEPSRTGVYKSTVLDSGMLSTWGTIGWQTGKPDTSSIEIYTRSGNTGVPDQTWNTWEKAHMEDQESQIESAPARFLQWKVEFSADSNATSLVSGEDSVESVSISYMQRNMAPQVNSITVYSPGVALVKVVTPNVGMGIIPGGPNQSHMQSLPRSIRTFGNSTSTLPPRQVYIPGAQSVSWIAEDANQDILRYSVYVRSAVEKSWRLLEEGASDNHYTMDGVSLPDGTYTVKVVVSDLASNSVQQALEGELISKPLVVANTLPVLALEVPQIDGDQVVLRFKAQSHVSVVHQVEYSIDSGEWNILLPEDGISDSRLEQYMLRAEKISSGEHVITIRVVDSVGNIGMGRTLISIP